MSYFVWTSSSDPSYIGHLAERYKRVIQEIRLEYEKIFEDRARCKKRGDKKSDRVLGELKASCKESLDYDRLDTDIKPHMVLVHPTEGTERLSSIARNDPNFRRVCMTITCGISLDSMYERGLREELADEHCDDALGRLVEALMTRFLRSDLRELLGQFVSKVVISGEIYSWVPLREEFLSGNGLSTDDPLAALNDAIPDDYVLVYIDTYDSWVARDLHNRPLTIHFIEKPCGRLQARSTVSYMADRYTFMNTLREHYLKASDFASTPMYLMAELPDENASDNDQKGTGERGQDLLDPRLVNQAKMNREIEERIFRKVSSSKQTAQQATKLHSSLSEYVSQLGVSYVKDAKENRDLHRQVASLQWQLDERADGCAGRTVPRNFQIPQNMHVPVSHMDVRPATDILSHECRYDTDWTSAAFGYRGHGAIYAERSQCSRSGRESMAGEGRWNADQYGIPRENQGWFVQRKRRDYTTMIANVLLREWSRSCGISLSPPCTEIGEPS